MPKERDERSGGAREIRQEMSHQSTDSWSPYAKVYDPIKIGSIDGTDTVPHDKAVVRALYSDYVPNKRVKGKASHTLFVGRLNHRTTQDTIIEEFSRFGKILHCRLVKDIVTGKSKRYAFVEYESSRAAYKAYKEMDKEFIDREEILVEYELERTMPGWKPRRLGGGFGGKREAGQLRFGGRSRPFLKPIIVKKNEEERERKEYKREYRNERERW